MEDLRAGKPVRPAVRVCVAGEPTPEWIEPLLWGLEEEGIPAELHNDARGSVEAAAWEAARSSPLNVGLAVDVMAKTAVLHHRDLPEDRPIFRIDPRAFESRELRRLGTNAARLVKGDPFLFGNPGRPAGCGKPGDPGELEELVPLVAAIVRGLLGGG